MRGRTMYLKLLYKRMHHLEDRVKASTTIDLTWDRAEAAALKWALERLDTAQERKRSEERSSTKDRNPPNPGHS